MCRRWHSATSHDCSRSQARGLALLAFHDRGGLLTFTSGGELYMARTYRHHCRATHRSTRRRRANRFSNAWCWSCSARFDHFDRQFSYVTVSRLLLAPLP